MTKMFYDPSSMKQIAQCLICVKDPKTCGATYEDQNAEGLCVKMEHSEYIGECGVEEVIAMKDGGY